MEPSIVELAFSSGDSREKRDSTEWLDLKSRVEEEKFRKLSADLERRRARRFLQHAEEERKVIKELNNLQRDRLRFEREKQLRQRNSFSYSNERRNSKESLGEQITQLPLNEKSFGASASLAFDPIVEKSCRPQRKTSKEQVKSYGSSVRKLSKELSTSNGFPYIDGSDVERFHKLCKSASKSECRRWGAAWFYAKKEQDVAEDAKTRWKSLLLKSEKEKMRVLSAKGVAFLDQELDENSCKVYESNSSERPSKGKENKYSSDSKKHSLSWFGQGKESRDSREFMELSKDEKLTFHKAFGRPQEETKEDNGSDSGEEFAGDEKLTFHKAFSLPLEPETKESSVSKGSNEIAKDEKLAYPKACIQPPARDAYIDGEKSQGATASQNASLLTPVNGRNILTLYKKSARDQKARRSKKSRKSTEGNDDFQENVLLPRLSAIPELDAEESSSSSSSEKLRNVPRRKRAICFLPNLTKES